MVLMLFLEYIYIMCLSLQSNKTVLIYNFGKRQIFVLKKGHFKKY